MNERALILGGGGATGNAWLIGVVAGLFDAGLDVSQADLIVGTSAGSTTAAQITGASPAKLYADILSATPNPRLDQGGPARAPVPTKPRGNVLEATSEILNTAEDAADMRRRIGAAALEMNATSDGSWQTQWRETVAARLPSQNWPERQMLIPAVDARSGEPVVFDRHSGVALVDAIAACCAGGGFAYGIGENLYIDGAYRADVNADLAIGYKRVLVIPPLADRTRKPLKWGLHLTAQVNELRTLGSRVETIFPDSASQHALGIGLNLMDLSRRLPSARAGYDQGQACAHQLSQFWN